MLLLAPRSSHCRVTADETRSQLDELLPGMVSVTGRARGLKATGNLLKMQSSDSAYGAGQQIYVSLPLAR